MRFILAKQITVSEAREIHAHHCFSRIGLKIAIPMPAASECRSIQDGEEMLTSREAVKSSAFPRENIRSLENEKALHNRVRLDKQRARLGIVHK